ncbi:DNA-(apurinic or apyrimidinic site) lyase 2 [Leucoagaricus sp. SymC.cos]|nr:DNA-(apurinic or apyrimidinic site) lyase 2 [Leucoagaricus sp. SymC.cos]
MTSYNVVGFASPLLCTYESLRDLWDLSAGLISCAGWNTKISARETNYGTRIDYILVTPGLVPWVKAADVQQDIKGSDHCPVFVDFHDEIATNEGGVIKLQDVLGAKPNADGKKEPPRLASKFWEEHSGKQTLLHTFFGKNKKTSDRTTEPSTAPPTHAPTSVYPTSQPLKRKLTIEKQSTQPASKKLKASDKKVDKKGKGNPGQAKLSSFFAKPASSQPSSSSVSNKQSKTPPVPDAVEVDDLDEDFPLSEEILASSQGSSSGKTNGDDVKQVWNSLLAPIQPPTCTVHGEPAKEFTVNKPGPNKGKKFFICSRPVGPGWDKGKAERLREEVDSTYRCNFFKWSSEWRKQVKQNGSTTSSSTRPPARGAKPP